MLGAVFKFDFRNYSTFKQQLSGYSDRMSNSDVCGLDVIEIITVLM